MTLNDILSLYDIDFTTHKEALKVLFEENHFAWLWETIRDYILNIDLWVFAVAPALALQFFWPRTHRKKIFARDFFFDACYPILFRFLALGAGTAAVVNFYLQLLPSLNTGILDSQPLWLQWIGTFLILDLMSYVSHRLLHSSNFLWQFHIIHHSATELNPMTYYRSHPGELIFRTVVRTAPVAFIGGESTTWVTLIMLNAFWDHYTHADTKFNFGPLKYILVTPHYHRIHHSKNPAHFNSNFANKLVLWDYLMKTYCNDQRDVLEVGITGTEKELTAESASPVEFTKIFIQQLLFPFIQIYKQIFKQSTS